METTRNHQEVTLAPAEKAKESNARESLRVVVFRLAGHEHAVEVGRVKEIVSARRIIPVAEAPAFVEGVIRLRGKIIPIIDLRKRLHLPPAERSFENCIIMIHLPKGVVGFLVDSASRLLTVPTGQIQPPTEMVGGICTRFIEGLAFLKDHFLVILDLNEVLTVDEKELLGEANFQPGDRSEPATIRLSGGGGGDDSGR